MAVPSRIRVSLLRQLSQSASDSILDREPDQED